MNAPRKPVFDSWAKFLNPQSLRSNLIAASIFLAAYETLCTSAIDRIRNFFAYDFDENGLGIESEDYKKKVLSLDKIRLRASLLWLKEMSAISDADIILVDEIRRHRNKLAHELPRFLTDADAEININFLVDIYELVTKIDRWWIREVDIPTNSDFDGQNIADSDIKSGSMIFIQMMLKIATGEDSSVFWDEFQKQTSSFWN
ncbi:MAG: hypothetical protein EAZ87_24045 [Nostocales cyanobacterium]|nr:MAG: hypothetical protein EAZ87_24045 [Nostocales cyanobacterium]